ncbi:histone-lysine N-methyltransferase PRDM7-like [Saccostrea echinata]|uniref:histone-lysine N-methyltransferase PRDM7-like n=1 Tax=Saccostrea echinata TaxID=191078 RepID=UPI002A81108B|nr:histone-lysine N-methyltransferase PRDM7-like [Saccostrea echinata]
MVFTLGNPKCKEGFVNVANWCFSFHRERATLAKSVEICEKTGGEMVILNSREKEMALTKYMEAHNPIFNRGIPKRESLRKSHLKLEATEKQAKKFCEFYKMFNDLMPSSKLYIPNAKIPVEFDENDRANLTTPAGFSIKLSSIPDAGLGAWAETQIPIYKVIGIYEGEELLENNGDVLYAWSIYLDDEDTTMHLVDAASPAKSNWLRYVNCARNSKEENVYPVFCDGLVFYMTTEVVKPNTELLVWYGSGYGLNLGIRHVHPEDDLDLDDVFYVRVSYLNQDYPGKFRFHDNTTVTYTNWNPGKLYAYYKEKYWKYDVPEAFGLLLSYDYRQWSWVPEKDYSYFTDRGGLLLPFVCEHRSNVKFS